VQSQNVDNFTDWNEDINAFFRLRPCLVLDYISLLDYTDCLLFVSVLVLAVYFLVVLLGASVNEGVFFMACQHCLVLFL